MGLHAPSWSHAAKGMLPAATETRRKSVRLIPWKALSAALVDIVKPPDHPTARAINPL